MYKGNGVMKKPIEYYNSILHKLTADWQKETLIRDNKRMTTKPSFKTDINNNTRQGNTTDQSYSELNVHMCEEIY